MGKHLKVGNRVDGKANNCNSFRGTVVEVLDVAGKRMYRVQWDNGLENNYHAGALQNVDQGGAANPHNQAPGDNPAPFDAWYTSPNTSP